MPRLDAGASRGKHFPGVYEALLDLDRASVAESTWRARAAARTALHRSGSARPAPVPVVSAVPPPRRPWGAVPRVDPGAGTRYPAGAGFIAERRTFRTTLSDVKTV
jgi:hypothetical protein